MLCETFTFPQSLGILGGKTGASTYIVGVQDNKALYLDPHEVQQVINNAHSVSFFVYRDWCVMSPRNFTLELIMHCILICLFSLFFIYFLCCFKFFFSHCLVFLSPYHLQSHKKAVIITYHSYQHYMHNLKKTKLNQFCSIWSMVLLANGTIDQNKLFYEVP